MGEVAVVAMGQAWSPGLQEPCSGRTEAGAGLQRLCRRLSVRFGHEPVKRLAVTGKEGIAWREPTSSGR
jgi:hypothetical protein